MMVGSAAIVTAQGRMLLANEDQRIAAQRAQAWQNFSNALTNWSAQMQSRTDTLNTMVQQQARSMQYHRLVILRRTIAV
jgi:hypothetical protein